MLRYGLLALQVVFVATSVFFVHRIVAQLLRADPLPELRIPAAEAPPARDRSFGVYQVIATRNLFNSRALAPAAVVEPPPPEEEIEESELRVKLVGTAATDPEEFSVAAVIDESQNENLQVRRGDILAGAEVVRIERNRIVVRNRGKLEAITLEEDTGVSPPRSVNVPRPGANQPAQPAARRPPTGGLAGRVRKLAQQAEATSPPARTEERAPRANILTQARMLPSYDEAGALRGLQLSGIKRGSALEGAGFQEGDVVRSVNGTEITSPAQGLRVLRELGTDEPVAVEVERAGERLTLDYAPEGS